MSNEWLRVCFVVMKGDFGNEKGPIICVRFTQYKTRGPSKKVLFSSSTKGVISAWNVQDDEFSKICRIRLQGACYSFIIRNTLLFCNVKDRPLRLLQFSKLKALKHKAHFQRYPLNFYPLDKSIQASANGRMAFIGDSQSQGFLGLSVARRKTSFFFHNNLLYHSQNHVNYSPHSRTLFVQFGNKSFAMFSTLSHKSLMYLDDNADDCLHSSQFLFSGRFLCVGFDNGKMFILDLISKIMRFSLDEGNLRLLTFASLPIPTKGTEIVLIGCFDSSKFYTSRIESNHIPQLRQFVFD